MARPAVKKEAIDQAAIHFFATKGVAETSIKEIALLAGVAEGALYRHYAGKNEMAWRLCCRETAAFVAELKTVLFAPGRPFRQRLRDMIEFLCTSYQEDPLLFSFIARFRHDFPTGPVPEGEQTLPAVMVRFVAEGMEGGEVPAARPEVAAALLTGAIAQPLFMHRTGEITIPPARLAKEIADICLRILSEGN